MFKAYYEHCPDGQIRWWQDNWFNDQFKILTKFELYAMLNACEIMGIVVSEGMPES